LENCVTALAFVDLSQSRTVLCIGAHCDDIEIGCGGTLRRIAREHTGVRFVWSTFSGDHVRVAESRAAAVTLLGPEANVDLRYLNFRESYFPGQFSEIKDAFEVLKRKVSPVIVFSHSLHDRHQDHRVLAELAWNTFRSSTILEYEIPKYEGDLGQPNFFVPLSEAELSHKVETLLRCFPSQRERTWFTPETFRGLARLRGIECASPSGYAEAFHARKLVV
jgi:LmbE family N-acetylglucosaminyl deacetylase